MPDKKQETVNYNKRAKTTEATEQAGRDKNIEEYNASADAYERWCREDVIMQKYVYYSTINEAKKEGIAGKTFLEVGCGPCPIGRLLAANGAAKIFGLDISSEMIENARRDLTKLGIIDQFELICHDVFDPSFVLPQKVDCVVLSYTLCTFISNYEMLTTILKRCLEQLKPDGYVLVADFSYVDLPSDEFEFLGRKTQFNGKGDGGVLQRTGKVEPHPFETFHYTISFDPTSKYNIFHIPSHAMFKAGIEAGFNTVDYRPACPHPDFQQNAVLRKLIDEHNSPDYVMKFKKVSR